MNKEEKINNWPLLLIFIISICIILIYLVTFGENGIGGIASFGAFGDYIGGLLNPLVALCALYYLYRGVKIQTKELKETREALERTSEAQRDQARQMKNNLAAQKRIETKKMSHQAEMTKLEFLMNYRLHLIKTHSTMGHIYGITSIQIKSKEYDEIRRGRGTSHQIQWHKEMEYVLESIQKIEQDADFIRHNPL